MEINGITDCWFGIGEGRSVCHVPNGLLVRIKANQWRSMNVGDSPLVCTMIGNLDRMLGCLRQYGASSRLAKARGDHSLAVRSMGRYHHLLKSGSGFLRYAHREFGVNREKDLRPAHGQAWAFKTDSPNTQKTRIEDLHWLERAYKQVMGLHLKLIPPGVHVAAVKKGTGQFSPEEQATIIAYARDSRNPALADALEYGAAIGLRPSEIVATRVRDYDVAAGVLHVPGIKWAHPRDVEIPGDLRSTFDTWVDGRTPDARLYPDVSNRSLERVVANANEALSLPLDENGERRSVMAFRGAFADEVLNRGLADGLDEGDARRAVAEQMGHGHAGIRPRIDVAKDHYLKRGDLGVSMRNSR